MQVVVKPQLTKTVAMFRIIDPINMLTPQTEPTSTALQAYLNSVWSTQANVAFTVSASVDMTVHYDVLPSPSGDKTLNSFQPLGSDLTEEGDIIALTKPSGNTVSLQANYVNTIGAPVGQALAAGYHIEGLTPNGSGFSFIEDTPSGTGPFNSRTNISAHELGHAVGTNDTYSPKGADKNVMWWGLHNDDPLNPCEVRRCDWSKMNPTTGDDGSTCPK
jgi:hypothetical protein